MIWKLIMAIVSHYIGEKLIELVFEKLLQLEGQTVKSLLDVVQGVLALIGLAETWEWFTKHGKGISIAWWR